MTAGLEREPAGKTAGVPVLHTDGGVSVVAKGAVHGDVRFAGPGDDVT